MSHPRTRHLAAGTVSGVGQRAGRVFDGTVAECRNALAGAMLYLVTKSMIANTK